MAKRKRRTKAEIEASKVQEVEQVIELDESTEKESLGLGDTIEKITKATGIDKLVKFVAGEDCGCDERRIKLNKIIRFKKINCLTEAEYNYLDEYFKEKTNKISLSQLKELTKIYNRVLNARNEPTSCSSCARSRINTLEQIYKEYN